MENFEPEKLFEKIDDPEILKALPDKFLHKKVILGIDIYKYSQYPLAEQIYIPVIFEEIYNGTVANLLDFETFFFKQYGTTLTDFKEYFISTGDGGFQIFNNPIEAILFSIYFQQNVKRFVSGSNTLSFRQKLHKIIDNIELRYCITYDLVYSFNKNFFGPGIINNSRILSKDNLNRMLIDSNTMRWFTNNINSVENFMDINKASFILTDAFKKYDPTLKSNMFDPSSQFISVDVLKIGSITAKNTSLDIYNLHMQATLKMKIDKHSYNSFVITLGNLNTAGIQ